MLCFTSKPSIRKQGLYHSLLVPTCHWERISMDFVGGLLTTRKGNDYMFMLVDGLHKVCVLIPCEKTINGK